MKRFGRNQKRKLKERAQYLENQVVTLYDELKNRPLVTHTTSDNSVCISILHDVHSGQIIKAEFNVEPFFIRNIIPHTRELFNNDEQFIKVFSEDLSEQVSEMVREHLNGYIPELLKISDKNYKTQSNFKIQNDSLRLSEYY